MSIGPFGSGAFGTGVYSATAFYETDTLIDAILRATGHSDPSRETAKRAVCLDALNNRYSTISTMQHWDWLYQEVDTLFKGPEGDGTINMTSRSQDVVGVGTTFSSTAIPNNVLSIPTRNETYLIEEVTSNVALVLEGEYAGDTEDSLDYQILKPIYTMPADLESIQSIQLHGVSWEMVPLGRQEFVRVKKANPGRVGPPRYFTEIGRRQADGVRLLEVYPAPDKDYSARVYYGVNIAKLEDSEGNFPLVPDRHRQILFYGGVSDMFAYLRDPVMSDKYENLYQLALLNMRNDTKITDSRIQLQPKRNYRNRSNRRKRGRLSYSASDFASEE